jgi:hypothetical protein
MTAGLFLALLITQSPLDAGTFVIRQDTVEVGRETFELSSIPFGRSESGCRIAAEARYNGGRGALLLEPTLDIGPDTEPLSLSYEIAQARERLRILGQRSRGRFTVRYLSPHSERAREYPLNGPTVILDDSVFSPYIFAGWRAGLPGSGMDVAIIVPRADRREMATVEELAPAPTTLNGRTADLRHVRLTGGANQVVHLWFDRRGLLQKIEIPSRHLVVERVQPA